MWQRKLIAVVSLLLFSIGSVRAHQQEDGIAALKTADGVLLVWNYPDIHFTLEIKGKDIRPMDSTEHVFLNVDGLVVQVQVAAFSQFLTDNQKQRPDDKSILLAHMNWEWQFIENDLLKKKINATSRPQKLSNGSDALLWKFEMPEGTSRGVKEQMNLTTVSGDYVIVLNSAVEGNRSESSVQSFLLDTINTLKVSSKPINLQELQEAIRKGNSR